MSDGCQSVVDSTTTVDMSVCCQQSTADSRLLITLSVQLYVQHDWRWGMMQHVVHVRRRRLILVMSCVCLWGVPAKWLLCLLACMDQSFSPQSGLIICLGIICAHSLKKECLTAFFIISSCPEVIVRLCCQSCFWRELSHRLQTHFIELRQVIIIRVGTDVGADCGPHAVGPLQTGSVPIYFCRSALVQQYW